MISKSIFIRQLILLNFRRMNLPIFVKCVLPLKNLWKKGIERESVKEKVGHNEFL